MIKLPVGIQLYTVRDFAEKDFAGTIKALKEMGYDYVEMAGTYGLSFPEIKKILDENDVKAISAHVPVVELLGDTDTVVKNYISIGCKYITIPYLSEDMRPGVPNFDEFLDKIAKIGEVCNANGATLLYHNHDFEFIKMPDGSYGLDYMYSYVPADKLQTELDTCWVNVAGENPADYIRKYAGRAPVVHLKDFVGGKSENMYELIGIESDKKNNDSSKFEFRPVGSGVQNFPAIIKAAEESGAEYVIVEQDQSYNIPSLESAKKSIDYLKTL